MMRGPKLASPNALSPADAPAAGPEIVTTPFAPSTSGTAALTFGPSHDRPLPLTALATRSSSDRSIHFVLVRLSVMKWSQIAGEPARYSPVSSSVKLWKPRPWPISCSSTVTKSVELPWLPSRPR